jgi:hypothetical protein
VISVKRAASSVSIETFTAARPASRSARACFVSSEAFVVSTTSLAPAAQIFATSSGTPRRTSGSPPVRRMRRVPARASTPTRRAISSSESSSRRSPCSASPPGGMQYTHAMSHRSVTLIRA